MKVFISWSGSASHNVAVILRDWIPSVLQYVEPYVSSEDMDKGARWSTDIFAELADSHYGILCVTRANVNAPWLNFEAGALSKSFDRASVSPFLFGLGPSDVPPGPLLQFQSTVYEADDVKKLITGINNTNHGAALDPARLERAFNTWWPELEERLDKILPEAQGGEDASTPDREEDDILVEVLDLVRGQERMLSTPANLLPRAYLAEVLAEITGSANLGPDGLPPVAVDDMERAWIRVVRAVQALGPDNLDESLHEALCLLQGPVYYTIRNSSRQSGRRVTPDSLLRLPRREASAV